MTIDKELIDNLLEQAKENPRLRQNYDLRTSSDDNSQRMLNALMPGTKVAIHRHPNSSENIICLCGTLDVILYDDDKICHLMGFEQGMDAQNMMRDKRLREIARYHINPSNGDYGCIVPKGVWHTVDVHENAVIYEAKDGKFGSDGSETF